MSDRKIIRNSVKCLICDEEIVSKHRHDFRRCSCGNISVDGGTAYVRRVGDIKGRGKTWVDTSIYEDDEHA